MSDIISTNSGNIAEEAPIEAASESHTGPQNQGNAKDKNKLGIALVGLGSYSEKQLGPALKETAYCGLMGVVSGHPEKCEKWRIQYNLKDKNLYSYENFDEIKSNPDIDIVYIVLPNAMHYEYVIRAAKAGKHVICEKPMATTVEDCERMIKACQQAGVKLSMGYRLHFDPFNQEMMRLGQNQVMGHIKTLEAINNMDVGDKNQWRLNNALAGGGPLMDVGIYCVQGALYTVGELPTAVQGKFHSKTDPEKFNEVEEGIGWEMYFPGGTKAFCECSYNKVRNLLKAETEQGWFELEPAYLYSGLKGRTSEGPMRLAVINQQAAQMDNFAFCIQNHQETRVPGEMGLRDLHILRAIYESAKTERRVELQLQEFQNLVEI